MTNNNDHIWHKRETENDRERPNARPLPKGGELILFPMGGLVSTRGPRAKPATSYARTVDLTGSVLLIQRFCRGLFGRWAAKNRLSSKLFLALEAIEEADGVRLNGFLEEVDNEAPSEDGSGQPVEPVDVVSVTKKLSCALTEPMMLQIDWPLTASVVLSLLGGFYRGGRLERDAVVKILEAEIALAGAQPNIVDATIDDATPLTVVGDLHGQLPDLLHIFRFRGFPSSERPYLFNGDFVDRGACGIEICLTVIAFHLLLPHAVFLNRGNHEEASVCGCHGFKQEVLQKYDEKVYALFLRAFARLPLATRVNHRVLVVHGGVDDELSLPTVQEMDRISFVLTSAVAGGGKTFGRPGGGGLRPPPRAKVGGGPGQESKKPVDAAACKSMTSLLWNDPVRERVGCCANSARKVGLYFGKDVLERFLSRHPEIELVRGGRTRARRRCRRSSHPSSPSASALPPKPALLAGNALAGGTFVDELLWRKPGEQELHDARRRRDCIVRSVERTCDGHAALMLSSSRSWGALMLGGGARADILCYVMLFSRGV